MSVALAQSKASVSLAGHNGNSGDFSRDVNRDLSRDLSRELSKERSASLSQPGEPPRFVKHPRPSVTVHEGRSVNLECRVIPLNDSSLLTEWYKDGRPLNAGSRFNTTFERGFVLLHIAHTFPDDCGEYSCVAKSNFGMDQSNPTTLTVVPDEGVVTETQLPEASMVANIDRLDERLSFRSVRQDYDDQVPQAAPQFTRPLENVTALENGSARFETRVTPAADPNVQVEWFKNGAPLTLGSRLRAVHDRGYTALEINCCYPEDNGQYHCVATNKHGRAQSNSAELRCTGSAGVVTSSALPESSVLNIKRLEEYSYQDDFNPLETEESQQAPEPPCITSDLSPVQLQVLEGSPATFEAHIAPGNGTRVQVVWFKDGQPVQSGSRVTASYEMSAAVLHFSHAIAEDSGIYCVVAASEHGRQQSGCGRLLCYDQGGVVTASQLPGNAEQSIRSLMLLEEELGRRGTSETDAAALSAPPPPRIVRGLRQPTGEVREGGQAQLDLQVEPSGDGDLTVEWFKDGEAVACAARVQTELLKGRAQLLIGQCKPEDSGTYWAVAQNRGGAAESNRVRLVCRAGEGVVTRSQLPGEAQGFRRLEELERQWRQAPIAADEFQFRETEEPPAPPRFDILPESCTVGQGDPVKVLVKVSGIPPPVVSWYLNDDPIAWSTEGCSENNLETSDATNYLVHKDGAISCLEVARCKEVGQHLLRVFAANQLGQVFAEAAICVVPAGDFRPELKHVEPDANFSRLAELRKVERSQELQQKISRPMGAAVTLRNVERESEIKSLTYRDPEVEEAERMYASVQARLRGGHYAGLPEGGVLSSNQQQQQQQHGATVRDLNPDWPRTQQPQRQQSQQQQRQQQPSQPHVQQQQQLSQPHVQQQQQPSQPHVQQQQQPSQPHVQQQQQPSQPHVQQQQQPSQPHVQQPLQPHVQQQLQPQVQQQVQLQLQQKVQPNVQQQLQPQVQQQVQPNVQQQLQPHVQQQLQPHVQQQLQPHVQQQMQPHLQQQLQPPVQQQVQPHVQQQVQPHVQQQVQPHVQQQMQPHVQQQVQPQVQQQVQPYQKVQPQVQPHQNVQTQVLLQNQVQQQQPHLQQLQMQPQMQSHIQPQVQRQVQMQPQVLTPVQMQSQVQPQVQMQQPQVLPQEPFQPQVQPLAQQRVQMRHVQPQLQQQSNVQAHVQLPPQLQQTQPQQPQVQFQQQQPNQLVQQHSPRRVQQGQQPLQQPVQQTQQQLQQPVQQPHQQSAQLNFKQQQSPQNQQIQAAFFPQQQVQLNAGPQQVFRAQLPPQPQPQPQSSLQSQQAGRPQHQMLNQQQIQLQAQPPSQQQTFPQQPVQLMLGTQQSQPQVHFQQQVQPQPQSAVHSQLLNQPQQYQAISPAQQLNQPHAQQLQQATTQPEQQVLQSQQRTQPRQRMRPQHQEQPQNQAQQQQPHLQQLQNQAQQQQPHLQQLQNQVQQQQPHLQQLQNQAQQQQPHLQQLQNQAQMQPQPQAPRQRQRPVPQQQQAQMQAKQQMQQQQVQPQQQQMQSQLHMQPQQGLYMQPQQPQMHLYSQQFQSQQPPYSQQPVQTSQQPWMSAQQMQPQQLTVTTYQESADGQILQTEF